MALKVLCAFQNEEVFDFVKSSLVAYECDLIKASSEALSLFLANKNFPCLIVCEYLPDGGWAVNLLNELKSESELQAIPVVFLVRRPTQSMNFPELEKPNGAEKLIWYPIESYEFISAIKQYLVEWKTDWLPETPE